MAGTSSRVTTGFTRLLVDTPAPGLRYPPHVISRSATQISRRTTDAAATRDVTFLPGNAWSLALLKEDLSRILTTEDEDNTLTTGQANLATGFEFVDTFRKPSDLLGIGATGLMIGSGAPALLKRVPAGVSWAGELVDDAAAFIAPLLGANVAMDRVLSGTLTYPQNCGFAITFITPGENNSTDVMLTFYFGGPVATGTSGVAGGEFCVSFFGDGQAKLQERDTAGNWKVRASFGWAQAGQSGINQLIALSMIPYGRDTIALRGAGIDSALVADHTGSSVVGPMLRTAGLALGVGNAKRSGAFYRSNVAVCGYVPGNSITGGGTVRLDVRRDLRTLIKIIRLRPPVDGVLVDAPVFLPWALPAYTPITVKVDTYLPEGTSIDIKMFTMGDVELAPSGSPTSTAAAFQAVANTQAYYVVFTLTSDEGREFVPVLYRYSVNTPGAFQVLAPGVSAYEMQSCSITGPDVFPDQDTASAVVKDPLNLGTTFRLRARQPCRVALYDDNSNLVSYLFEGEIASATAKLRGKPGKVYPSPSWRDYELSMVGAWARLVSAGLNLTHESFADDPDLPGEPWKVTDVIAYVLEKAGYSEGFRDIPDLPLRLWPSDSKNLADLQLFPTASIADFLNRLTQDYLGSILLWDPNAGAYGMWRLLLNRTSPGTALMNFLGQPTVAGRIPTHVNSYSSTQTFIRNESYTSRIVPPEGNYVIVTTAELFPTDVGPNQAVASMYNPLSVALPGGPDYTDPTSPDYLGFFAPIAHVDPTLGTKEACSYVCRRIFEYACHAQKWVTFESPLAMVSDSADSLQVRARSLRINDPVTVLGENALIRSCNPDWSGGGSDRVRMAYYEALILPS